MSTIIYHITETTAWQAATAVGRYEGDTLASEGFIHCSEAHQIARIACGGDARLDRIAVGQRYLRRRIVGDHVPVGDEQAVADDDGAADGFER